jgi:large subunit ribosomal protein LP0
MGMTKEKKAEYFLRMEELINKYSKVFVVGCDNVGSLQMQQIRLALRPLDSIVLMGKNTMMRKIVNNFLEANPGHAFGATLPLIQGNVGFVFTNSNLAEVRNILEANRVPAPARVGAISPIDVVIPPGPTDCDPGQTAFFQTLQIATKIVKGRIEITSPVELLKTGDKVGNSEAALLQKLDIRPFTYGLVLQAVYDNGSVFSPEVLNITNDDLICGFSAAVRNVAALSYALEVPTFATVPHSIANAFKTLVSIAVECEDYTFEKANAYKKAVKN